MNRQLASFVAALALVCMPALGAPPATAPTTQNTHGSLGGGLVTYTPPTGWELGKVKGNVSSFVTAKHDGIVAIELLPPKTEMIPQATDAIVKQLQLTRQKSGVKVLLNAVAESDPRFALKVHERYEVGRKDGTAKVADQLHIYRPIGNRVVMMTVNTVADDPEVVKATHQQAEEMLMSAVLHGFGEKKPAPKPAK